LSARAGLSVFMQNFIYRYEYILIYIYMKNTCVERSIYAL
jgi:hypothetical protein